MWFYCLWCRMRVTAFCQIFEFLHPFQWTRIKQQILCYLNNMMLSMTVAIALRSLTIMMWDFIVYGAEGEWRLFVRSLSFCTLSSEYILSSRFCVLWITWCFQWLWCEFLCLWCRMRVTAFSQIFEFLHPFQWTRIKQQILCYLNNMVLSMTVAIAF